MGRENLVNLMPLWGNREVFAAPQPPCISRKVQQQKNNMLSFKPETVVIEEKGEKARWL